MTSIKVKNDNAATIPPFSVVVVVSVEYTTGDDNTDPDTIFHVNQYDGIRGGTVLVTGYSPILPTGMGKAHDDTFALVAIDGGITAPKNGEQWGPIPNKWYISRGMPGFIAQDANSSAQTIIKCAPFYRVCGGEVTGLLSSTISPGSSDLTVAQTGTMTVYFADPSSSSFPKGMVASSLSDITIVNRDPTMTGVSGKYARAKQLNTGPKLEWELTWIGNGC